MRCNLAREQNKSDWYIEELREALLREIRLLGQGVFTPTTCLSGSSQMMTATLYTGTRSGHSRQCRSDRGAFNKKLTVVYYKGTHTTNNCDVIVSTEKRLEHFKREGPCLNCLGKHRVNQCTSQTRCKKCHNQHHTSICATKSLLPPIQQDHLAQYTETKSQSLMQKDLNVQSSKTNPAQVTQNTVPVTATTTLANICCVALFAY